MKAEFAVTDPVVLANIVDKDTYGANILSCHGNSILTVGGEIIYDSIEVIIRIAELVNFADDVCDRMFPYGVIRGFNYKFEQPFFVEGASYGVNIISRNSDAKLLEKVTYQQAEELRNDILKFVEKNITPSSPFLAAMIYNRSIL